MNKKIQMDLGQVKSSVIFLLISALVLGTVVKIDADNEPTTKEIMTIQTSEEPEIIAGMDAEIPVEVLNEAERLAQSELKYVQKHFEEYGYTQNRIEKVDHVHTCEDVEGEVIEVYGITFFYRRAEDDAWERAENSLSSYLIFRQTDDGTLEWLGDFRDGNTLGTVVFTDHLHDRLMDIDEKFLYKLQADSSLDIALEQTTTERVRRIVPGDGFVFGWKQLALEDTENSGTAYGLSLFYTTSGSPLIYSETTDRYVSAIYSAYLLPMAISYQQDSMGRYVVTGYWEPSQMSYEDDVRNHFPAEAAENILKNIDNYTMEILKEYDADQQSELLAVFSGGPVWPTYYFNEALDDTQLCGLVVYYGDEDIYTDPIRAELYRRFWNDPVSLLNGLGICYEEIQNSVCTLISARCNDSRFPTHIRFGLTQEGQSVYTKILQLAGITEVGK